MGTNLKICPFNLKYRRTKRNWLFYSGSSTWHWGRRKGFQGSRGISRGRYLASGLEPYWKFSSCFYQMAENLFQSKWALACTMLNLEGIKEENRWDLNLACSHHQWYFREFCSFWEVNLGIDCPPYSFSLLLCSGYSNFSIAILKYSIAQPGTCNGSQQETAVFICCFVDEKHCLKYRGETKSLLIVNSLLPLKFSNWKATFLVLLGKTLRL